MWGARRRRTCRNSRTWLDFYFYTFYIIIYFWRNSSRACNPQSVLRCYELFILPSTSRKFLEIFKLKLIIFNWPELRSRCRGRSESAIFAGVGVWIDEILPTPTLAHMCWWVVTACATYLSRWTCENLARPFFYASATYCQRDRSDYFCLIFTPICQPLCDNVAIMWAGS